MIELVLVEGSKGESDSCKVLQNADQISISAGSYNKIFIHQQYQTDSLASRG